MVLLLLNSLTIRGGLIFSAALAVGTPSSDAPPLMIYHNQFRFVIQILLCNTSTLPPWSSFSQFWAAAGLLGEQCGGGWAASLILCFIDHKITGRIYEVAPWAIAVFLMKQGQLLSHHKRSKKKPVFPLVVAVVNTAAALIDSLLEWRNKSVSSMVFGPSWTT